MRDRHDPWKWPVSIALALVLTLATALWLPRSWLGFLLAPRAPAVPEQQNRRRAWLALQPPPEVEVSPPQRDPHPPSAPPPLRRLHQDPRWWTEGWVAGAAQDEALYAPATKPSATRHLLMTELGLGAEPGAEARPDSALAVRLFVLRLRDGFRYDELKPYLSQRSRADAYADILSRAADMYDEHLQQEIRVPD